MTRAQLVDALLGNSLFLVFGLIVIGLLCVWLYDQSVEEQARQRRELDHEIDAFGLPIVIRRRWQVR